MLDLAGCCVDRLNRQPITDCVTKWASLLNATNSMLTDLTCSKRYYRTSLSQVLCQASYRYRRATILDLFCRRISSKNWFHRLSSNHIRYNLLRLSISYDRRNYSIGCSSLGPLGILAGLVLVGIQISQSTEQSLAFI